jgi:hypothetical protein
MKPDTRDIIGQAVLETLEDRNLFSSVTLDGHILSLTGDAETKNQLLVELSEDGAKVRGVVNGVHGMWVDRSVVKTINIVGGEDADTIWVNPALKARVRVDAGEGADHITTAGGNDTINAGPGDDFVYAGPGHDRVHGEDGADTLVGGGGNDTIVGAVGNDSLIGGGGHDRLFTGSGTDYASGGAGNDVINATHQDTIAQGPGGARVTTIQDPGAVLRLVLINADTNRPILNLRDGQTLDLASLPSRKLNIEAVVSDGFNGLVQFGLNGKTAYRVEGIAPYALMGDNAGAFKAWTPTTGTYTLDATTSAGRNIGGSLSLRFRVTDSSANTGGGSNGNTNNGSNNTGGGSNNNSTGGANNNTGGGSNNNGGGSTIGILAPDVRIDAVSRTITAGQALHVSGLRTLLKSGNPADAIFEWDFGDGNGQHNKLRGFNAAHVYENPGTYTVRLKVTDSLGRTASAATTVQVVAPARKVIYVSNAGSDSNSGLSSNSPVKTASKAFSLLDSNTEIRFKRGERFDMTRGAVIGHADVVIGAYGVGDLPTLNWNGARDRSVMITLLGSARNVSVQDLRFDSRFRSDTDQTGMPYAIRAGGTALTIVRNEFLNLGYAINLNGKPTGVLIADNSAPLETGIRDYFTWASGTQISIVGNNVANATREHVVRVSNAEQVLLARNDFTNLDRRDEGDRYDTAKGAIVVQMGQYAYVYGNKADGPTGVGPLGDADGLKHPEQRFKFAVLEANDFTGTFTVHHGAENVRVSKNLLRANDTHAIQVEGFNAQYGRGVVRLNIDGNLGANAGTRGSFLRVLGSVAGGISLTGNTYAAPNLQPGAYGAAAVYVAKNNLDDFTVIRNNTWPIGSNGLSYAQGGVMFVGATMSSAGYRDPSEWNGFGVVNGDTFRSVKLNDVLGSASVFGGSGL